MRIKERYELALELRDRYWAARREERGQMLDGYCLATGYNRKYAIEMLRVPATKRCEMADLPVPSGGIPTGSRPKR
jgi:hypothetical protein